MKVSNRDGHNELAQGANGLVNEVEEDRKIGASVRHHLQLNGMTILNVTQENMDADNDLYKGVEQSNAWGADYFGSIHLNAYNHSASGCEVLHYPGSVKGKAYAESISRNIAALGFENRGAIPSSGMYELHKTNCPANIIECFFCDSPKDVALYKSIGPDRLGKAIADGICEVALPGFVPKPYFVTTSAPVSHVSTVATGLVIDLQKFLNVSGVRDSRGNVLAEDNSFGPCSRSAFDRLYKSVMAGIKIGTYKNVDLQAFLNNHGFTDKNGKRLVLDGSMGPLSRSSLIKLRNALGVY